MSLAAAPLSAVLAAETASTRKHHKFGPSRLEYLDHCAAFTNREDGGNEYSEEGQLLHDYMSAMLTEVAEKRYKTTMEQATGWVVQQNDPPLTEEQLIYLRFCCRRVDEIIAQGPIKILTEIPISVKNPDGTELNHGYLDVLFIFADGVGVLIDFKFGWIPVPHAKENLQGWNYMLASFQQFPELLRIGVQFMQPKLNLVTDEIFDRPGMFDYYSRIKEVIDNAIAVQDKPEEAQKRMAPGAYCEYCALKATCGVLANHRAEMGSKFSGLPVLRTVNSLEIASPEEWALARYWCEVVEKGIEDLKKRAYEFAENNGGELRCTLPNGEEVVYEVQERNADRCLGSATEVAEALKEQVSYEEILGAADLALTKLEKICKTAMTDIAKAEGRKLTKKAAWEQTCSTLEALGLLSRPDTKIRYLKLKRQAPKELVQGDADGSPAQEVVDLSPAK